MVINMKLTRFVLIHTLCIFILNFPLHFLYDVFPNFVTSLLSPVNESIFEHMKMVFTSFVLFGLFDGFFFHKKEFASFFLAELISSVIAIGVFLILYVPFILNFKENMIITFIFLFLSILISQIACYYILFFTKLKYQKWFSIGILVVFYSLFYYLTYYPPKLEFFKDPQTNTYSLPS